jgi:hypothetical protein
MILLPLCGGIKYGVLIVLGDRFFQDTFTAVTGKFTVPTPKKPSGSSGTHAASAWVGIDGDTCETAILQTGVDFTIDEDDNVSFDGMIAPTWLLFFS